jgi:hypothetical protein
VFIASPWALATPELLGWPQLIAVTDLASALAAVEEITEQGEGCAGDWPPPTTVGSTPCGRTTTACGSAIPRSSPPVLPGYARQPFGITAPSRSSPIR